MTAGDRGRRVGGAGGAPQHTGRHRIAEVLLTRIWELRDDVTAYDAAYLALAEALDAPLVTRDKALTSSGIHRARVELV